MLGGTLIIAMGFYVLKGRHEYQGPVVSVTKGKRVPLHIPSWWSCDMAKYWPALAMPMLLEWRSLRHMLTLSPFALQVYVKRTE